MKASLRLKRSFSAIYNKEKKKKKKKKKKKRKKRKALKAYAQSLFCEFNSKTTNSNSWSFVSNNKIIKNSSYVDVQSKKTTMKFQILNFVFFHLTQWKLSQFVTHTHTQTHTHTHTHTHKSTIPFPVCSFEHCYPDDLFSENLKN